uniref:G-protein coupled receptors family 2 profile 2 domain-containing protein n=1 Tax=Lates calcarifer TaxID=8187 RepID=A0A4W6DTJ6_LATCA
MRCVYWDNKTRDWSSEGCRWEHSSNNDTEGECICNHLSSFAILMAKYPVEIPGMNEITIVGLSISVLSLILSLLIELTVWSAVVKTHTLYLRHTAHVNISLCLLVADCCFLASSEPSELPLIWCQTFVVLKHFCYLAMFFWMLCLSITLLHQAVFLFHSVSKKNYLRFSLVLGYVCPLLIVTITFLTNKGGAEGAYFTHDTCWLVYSGLLQGSIHTFLIPVGIIVFVNVFSMLVVIMKLLNHPKNADKSQENEKAAAKTVMRSVVLLTPIFGITWVFGNELRGPNGAMQRVARTLLFSVCLLLLLLLLGPEQRVAWAQRGHATSCKDPLVFVRFIIIIIIIIFFLLFPPL